MRKLTHIVLLAILWLLVAEKVIGSAQAGDNSIQGYREWKIEDILEDICNELLEEGSIGIDEENGLYELEEELLEIAENPINLNNTTAKELSRLRFLSDEQIDAILLQQYEQPFQSIYELQLVDCLKDYEIRNLIPFVYVGDVYEAKKMYIREIFAHAKHEISLRTDARNLEDFDIDPMYGKLRYRFNYQNRVQAGITVMRQTSEGVMTLERDRWSYGGYIQLRDIGPMKTVVAGNFQASFGYGLVVGSTMKRGKSAYIQSTAATEDGLKKISTVGNDYNHFHGIGATAKVKWAEVSGWYSLREEKDGWGHVLGVNATGRWKKLKVGLTAIENISISGNENSNFDQAIMGVNARWNSGKVDIWGEVATSQAKHSMSSQSLKVMDLEGESNRWGFGAIGGIRYTPISGINVLGIYRYYSPEYDNRYANALCSWTRMRDEHGGYIGIEYNRLKNWKLYAFGDIWKNGFETLIQAQFISEKDYDMHWRFRVKRKDEKDTYSLRWNTVYHVGRWKMKTQVDCNLVQAPKALTYGGSIYQDVEYRFVEVPIVLQLRAQAFDARNWDNRVYIYENDVLYAYAIPFVYGLGERFWLNARYKINDIFSVYLRISETILQSTWAHEHAKPSTRTDIHALLRVKL